MQINPNEMRLIAGAQTTLPPTCGFQLPKFHKDVPVKAVFQSHDTTVPELAKALVEAGVIRAGSLPKTVETPLAVVQSGLRTWFEKRATGLNLLKFNVGILDRESAEGLSLFPGDSERTLTGKYVLFFEGYEDGPVLLLKDKALHIEAKVQHLFRYAYQVAERAGWKTMSFRTPMQTMYEAAMQLWEADYSTIPNDDEVREMLIDRGYDEGGEDLERYMPDEILEVFGEGYCLPPRNHFRFKRGEILSRQTLRQLVKSEDEEIALIAARTLSLQRAVNRFTSLKGDFPDMHGIDGEAIFPPCTVMFEDDTRAFQFIDDEMNCASQAGCSSSFIGIDELPDTAQELKTYFRQLSAGLSVLRHMDALLALITTRYEPK